MGYSLSFSKIIEEVFWMDKTTTIGVKEENKMKLDEIQYRLKKQKRRNFTMDDTLAEILKYFPEQVQIQEDCSRIAILWFFEWIERRIWMMCFKKMKQPKSCQWVQLPQKRLFYGNVREESSFKRFLIYISLLCPAISLAPDYIIWMLVVLTCLECINLSFETLSQIKYTLRSFFEK